MTWLEGEGDELRIGEERFLLRPIRPDDTERLMESHLALSDEAKRLRFFSPHPRLSVTEAEHFTHVDHRDREALLLLAADRIVGVGRYDRLPETAKAEVAFVVADRLQGHGIATTLLQRLARHARSQGIECFIAHTLPENRKMLEVFAHAGFETTRRWEDGVVYVELALPES